MNEVKINIGTIGARNNVVYPTARFAAVFSGLALKMANPLATTSVTRSVLQSEMEDKIKQIDDKLYTLAPTANLVNHPGVIEDIALQTMVRVLHSQLLESSDKEIARLGVDYYRLIK